MTTSVLPDVERPLYFDGQRLTAADLTAGSDYARAMRQLHNRALHGWGIAVGLGASGARGDKSVHVEPGLALDCGGRELLLTAAQDVAVPPVAEKSSWFLVISGVPEDQLVPSENLAGVCDTDGAVRLLDAPLLRWLSADGKDGAQVQQGLDVILAGASIANCKLDDDLDLDPRQQLAPEQPYVAAGRTEADGTVWRPWPAGGAKQAGVITTVSTAEAGFRMTPSYQARLAGKRTKGNVLFDGPVHIEGASATAFDFVVDLSSLGAKAKTFNSATYQGLGWQVVWMGVETQ
jgi:hypothetical protein